MINSTGSVHIVELENKLITLGFIDTYVHYPQTGMIATYSEQFLDWLDNYTFPEEKRFVLMTLGDDRTVCDTYAYGRSVYRK